MFLKEEVSCKFVVEGNSLFSISPRVLIFPRFALGNLGANDRPLPAAPLLDRPREVRSSCKGNDIGLFG